jgi:hypothetical protein
VGSAAQAAPLPAPHTLLAPGTEVAFAKWKNKGGKAYRRGWDRGRHLGWDRGRHLGWDRRPEDDRPYVVRPYRTRTQYRVYYY